MFSQRNNPYCDLLQFRYYKYSRYNSYQEDFLYLFSIFEKMNKKIGYEKDIGSRFRNK